MGKISQEEWCTWYKKELQNLNDLARKKITEVEFKNEKNTIFVVPYLTKEEKFDFDEFLRQKSRSFCKVKKNDRIVIRRISKNSGELSETMYFVEDVNLYYNSDIKDDFQHQYKLKLHEIKESTTYSPFKAYTYFELEKNTLIKDTTNYIYIIEVLNE